MVGEWRIEQMVGLQEKNKVLVNLLVHHKSHINWPVIETWLFVFLLLHVLLYFCTLHSCINMYVYPCINVELVTAH
jgi:hypothetical protein